MEMQREYWNDVAGPKWAAAQAQMDEMLAPYAESLREAARVGEGETVVDVGCGCGATTLMAAEHSPGAEVVGLDVSEPMLEVARRRAEERGATSIRFVSGDAATHALPSGSVRRIISRFGVMFFADPVSAFAHMRGWLAPGGSMVFAVWGSPHENPWMTDTLDLLSRHFELPPPNPEAPGPFSLGDAARRRSVFERAGLRVVEERALLEPMCVRGDVPALIRFYSERGPVATALASASEAQREAALDDLRAYVEARHDGEAIRSEAKALRLTLEAR